MRRLVSVVLPLAVLAFSPIPTKAQERSAELQRMEYFIGSWADTPDGVPVQVSSWLGESFLQSVVVGDDGSPTTLFIFGYDAEAEAYTTFRFYGSSGFFDTGRCWVDGNTWTILFEDNPSRIVRFTGVEESEDVWAYKWERSTEGGEWVETSAGVAYRVK